MMLGLFESLQYGCLTFSWRKEPWSRSCRGRIQVAQGTKDYLTIMPTSTTRLSCIFSSFFLFPSISSSSSPSSVFSSSTSSFSSSFRRFGRPPGPPSSPAGTYRTGTGKSERTKNRTKKNQKEPKRTKWQLWCFPQPCLVSYVPIVGTLYVMPGTVDTYFWFSFK